ncbi:hypothetical protein ACOMHN_039898 [Nucella lapillus]
MEKSVNDSLKEALKDPEIWQMLSSALSQSLREEIASLHRVTEKKDEIIEDLQTKVDSLEQYTRRNSISISGVPEHVNASAQEDTDLVQKLGEAVGVKLTKDVIDRSHRVGRQTGTDRQFTSYSYKRTLMVARSLSSSPPTVTGEC